MHQDLFGKEVLPEKPLPAVRQPQEKKAKMSDWTVSRYEDEKYTNDYCFKSITSDSCLWDMRCWDEYHNKDEVMRFLDQVEEALKGGVEPASNYGNVVFCIKLLLQRGVSKEDIANAMLLNDNIMYSRRIVKCFADASECPKFIANGEHFGNDICKDCGNPPKEERKKKVNPITTEA